VFAAANMGQFRSEEVGSLLWAFATVGATHAELADAAVVAFCKEAGSSTNNNNNSNNSNSRTNTNNTNNNNNSNNKNNSNNNNNKSSNNNNKSNSSSCVQGSWAPRETANLLWALAVMGHHHPAALQRGTELLARAAQVPPAVISDSSLLDLHLGQWYLAWLGNRLENSSTPAAAGSKIDQAWVDKCCQVARHRAVSQ
ncbi:unnamed protein product, partial [Polarella glacialis]